MPAALLIIPGTLLLLVLVLATGAWAEARLATIEAPPRRRLELTPAADGVVAGGRAAA